MRVWIAGSRRATEAGEHYDAIERCLMELCQKDDLIILGGADGVDETARAIAHNMRLSYAVIPARWTDYGLAAGPIRNQFIVDKWKPQMLIAFPGRRSKGTIDALRKAKKAGIEIAEHRLPAREGAGDDE